MSEPKPTKVIILVRHAESNGNVRFQAANRCWRSAAHCSMPSCSDVKMLCDFLRITFCSEIKSTLRDPELSDVGEAQAANVASQLQECNFMRNEGVELVVHSGMRRTKRTCDVLFGSSQTTTIEKRVFREWDLIESLTGESCGCSSDGTWATRVHACLEYLAMRPEQVIVVVGHGMLFKAFQRGSGAKEQFGNVEMRRFHLDVTSLTMDAGELLFQPALTAPME
mmetsp:Transcript_14209/g.25099  ORF Transcript_14209/g.25099 Transcript_14209/m.25099 type:complete len:224 (-) Transcript_14209:329-1000(-)